jgi:hypothetical protein
MKGTEPVSSTVMALYDPACAPVVLEPQVSGAYYHQGPMVRQRNIHT